MGGSSQVERWPRMGPFLPTLGRSSAGVLTDPVEQCRTRASGGLGVWGIVRLAPNFPLYTRPRGASQHAGPYGWIAAASGFRRRNPNSRVAPYGGPGRGWVRGVRGERGREGGEFYFLRKKLSTLARREDARKLSQIFPKIFLRTADRAVLEALRIASEGIREA